MAEQQILMRNTKAGIEKEVTEGTLVTELNSSAVLLRSDGLEINIGRESLEEGFMTGSLSKTAPIPGMYADDIGWTYPTFARGKGTLPKPDFHVAMESLFGVEEANTNDAVAASPTPTTTAFTANSGANDLAEGQLIMVNGEITQITDIATEALTVWPPLSATPTALDVIHAGCNWMLSSTAWPTFSSFLHFDGDRLLTYAGCRVNSLSMTFEVGQRCQMDFGIMALTPAMSTTAMSTTPALDTTTAPPTCLGMVLSAMFAGVAKGTPTTTSTILSAPNFDVAVGDEILQSTSTGWETKAVSVVSGNLGGDITLTHAAFSEAATAGETVYIRRKKCASIGDSLTINIEMEVETLKCMQASSGKMASLPTSRTVTIEKTPYFKSWQEFLMRDNVVGAELMIKLGSATGNIFAVYMPNVINSEVGLGTDALMRVDATAQAVVGSRMGNNFEIVAAAF